MSKQYHGKKFMMQTAYDLAELDISLRKGLTQVCLMQAKNNSCWNSHTFYMIWILDAVSVPKEQTTAYKIQVM